MDWESAVDDAMDWMIKADIRAERLAKQKDDELDESSKKNILPDGNYGPFD